jgi:SRSO17 transposase
VKDFSQHFHSYRRDVSDKARQYLSGLMQAGGRKNMLKMSEVVPDVDNRNLQQFLTHSNWSARNVMNQVAQQASQLIGDDKRACLLIDESGFAKQGKKSVGTARQWLGRLGKVDNGQVAVFGVLCKGGQYAPVDCRLYLPKEWTDDPQRCIDAGMNPEEIVFATKEQLALEIIDHARSQGAQFGWVGADAGYGKSPHFFHALEQRGEKFFIDVHSDFGVYLEDPRPRLPQSKGKRPCKTLKTDQPLVEVRKLENLKKPGAWKEVAGRDSTRGKINLRVNKQTVWVWDGKSPQPLKLTLLVSENLDGAQRKYTLTNAPQTWTLGQLVYAHGQRYWVERSFEDAKGQCGMADYQVQKWTAWRHHMALVMMVMLFMLQEKQIQKGRHPLLSSADIEAMLARFLPRRDVNVSDVVEQIRHRHRLRQQAIDSHFRTQKQREKLQT